MSKPQKTRSRKSQREATPRTSWVRFAIDRSKGRRLRVLIYARFSTDEQNPRSIEAQISYCKRFLTELGITDVEIVVLYDKGISGEIIFRPGINEVRAGIDARQWDLIIVEDCSRLFRNEMACVELANNAVDQEIRMFCINDEVDTADEEYWEDRLYDAARHHARSNRFTSRRIKRAHEALWDQLAAIGMLKPGYRRNPTYPATGGEPESGPYFDELDPDQARVVEEAYQRIAALESGRSVGHWLKEIGFRQANGSVNWTAKNVIALIRRTDYRGVQTYRNIISKKKRVTGERRAARNDSDKVLTREMPHLRIVSDALWYQANKAIDDRDSRPGRPRGAEHPLAGIPRDSRGPLANIFCCGCCHEKMYAQGRNEGGYRCSQSCRGRCWNKASAVRDATHRWLGEAIAQKLLSLDDSLDRLLEQVPQLFADQGHRAARRAELLAKEQSLEMSLERLATAIDLAEEPPDTLVRRIVAHESDLEFTVAELSGLELQDENFTPPTRQQVAERIEQLVGQLRHMDRRGRDDLECLTGRIEAVPYQQYGGNKVVLRARFELHLAALLPFSTRAALAGLCDGSIDVHFESIPMLVDLFERSTKPRYGLAAVRLADEQKLGPTAIAESLGIEKHRASLALQYGRSLQAAGLTDPFIELTQPPAKASHWRSIQPREPEPTREAA